MKNRRLALAILLIAVLALWFLNQNSSSNVPTAKDLSNSSSSGTKQTKKLDAIDHRSIFVPYWQLNGRNTDLVLEKKYNRYIYFGLAGTSEGIRTDDAGYEHIEDFISGTTGSRWLTIRMTDSGENDKVIGSRESQLKIVNDAVRVASKYGFEGLVLDFEYGSLFGGDIDNITSFYKLFREKTKAADLEFAVTMYGDVFYRKRPYDVAEIAKNSDEIMIMAYDLHKSRGEPGPNFPLRAGGKYGYGYDLLFEELEKNVSADKITVIFGMYGYDWKVDEQKRPITLASSITTAQVSQKYLDSCDAMRCTQFKDPVSAEMEINYVDEEGRYHIIWFENEDSTKKKEEFLKIKGVGSVAYWAFGYF